MSSPLVDVRRAAAVIVAAGVLLAAPVALETASAAGDVGAAVGADDDARVVCRFSDDRLEEISGITWSRRHPGVYWVHNDSSGGPYLYAVDGTTCRTRARIRVEGIEARDIEAIATGTDPQGQPVLWVGDIGDNRSTWPDVRLIAVREPDELVDQSVSSTTYRFTYPGGSSDAEAILAEPDTAQVWVVSKALGRSTVYRVPLSTSQVTTAVRVADVGAFLSDAAMAPDGSRFVIRGYVRAQLYDAPVRRSTLGRPTPVTLPSQQQGEAISFTRDGEALLVASEGERELWQVPLPAAAPSASPDPSGSESASASAGSSDAPSASSGGAAAGTAPWRVGLAGLALVAAAGIAVVAVRRFRS